MNLFWYKFAPSIFLMMVIKFQNSQSGADIKNFPKKSLPYSLLISSAILDVCPVSLHLYLRLIIIAQFNLIKSINSSFSAHNLFTPKASSMTYKWKPYKFISDTQPNIWVFRPSVPLRSWLSNKIWHQQCSMVSFVQD